MISCRYRHFNWVVKSAFRIIVIILNAGEKLFVRIDIMAIFIKYKRAKLVKYSKEKIVKAL